MPSNVYCVDEELWNDSVSARPRVVPTTARQFETNRANISGREKHSRYARHSRASRSSQVSGGISRRSNRRTV
jgi:hypothetical protein